MASTPNVSSNNHGILKRKIFALLEDVDRRNCDSPSLLHSTIASKKVKTNEINANNSKKNVPLSINDLHQTIQQINMTTEEWQCGVKYAIAIADHITHNMYVSEYYKDVKNIKNIVANISRIVSKHSFAHTQFVARMYSKNGNIHRSVYENKLAMPTESGVGVTSDDTCNDNCNQDDCLIPLLLAWGLHINSHIHFIHFLLQNAEYVALSWAKTAGIVNTENNNENDLSSWFNAASLMFLKCCIGMYDDGQQYSSELSSKLFSSSNSYSNSRSFSEHTKDLKNHCLKILSYMRVKAGSDIKRAKLLRLLVKNAKLLKSIKSKTWLGNFARSSVFHILELPYSIENFISPSNTNVRDGNNNIVITDNEKSNDGKRRDDGNIYLLLHDFIEVLSEEAYIETIEELLKSSNVGTNIHWDFLKSSISIIRKMMIPNFIDKIVINVKLQCIKCLKDCKAANLASLLRFIQHLSLSTKEYKICLQSLFDTTTTTTIIPTTKCVNTNINSLKVQKSSSPSNKNINQDMMMLDTQGVNSYSKSSRNFIPLDQENICIEPSKRVFSTFLKSLELLVPSDSLEYLHVHKHIVLPYRSRYRSICGDLIGLINTRVDDLRLKSNKEYEVGSKRDNIAKDVVAYVNSFHKTGGNIPQALLQTALFRKQFFVREFLPVILSNTQTFICHEQYNFHDERKKLVCQLSDKSLIPPSIFANFLKQHSNNSTQSSNNSSQMSNANSDSFLSKISKFALVMSEYGEIASAVAATKNCDNDSNAKNNTKHIDFQLKRKKMKIWKEYLEKLAIELSKHQQDEEYLYALIDAIGNAIAISFNSGYDYVSMQRWIRDIFNIMHQSQIMDPMKVIINKWILSIDPATVSFNILVLATFVTHTMHLTKSYTDWSLDILKLFMNKLLHASKHAPEHVEYKCLVLRFYEYFYLCVVSHFDRLVISKDSKMTEAFLQNKYNEVKKVPFIISIISFRMFYFLAMCSYNGNYTNDRARNDDNSTSFAIISSIKPYLANQDILKVNIREYFILSCFFTGFNSIRNGNDALTSMSQFVWSKQYIAFDSINRLFVDLLKSCIFYKILKNTEPMQQQGLDKQPNNSSTKLTLLNKWQNKVSSIWKVLNENLNTDSTQKWNSIIGSDAVNSNEIYQRFLLQTAELLSSNNSKNYNEKYSILNMFLCAMEELKEELLIDSSSTKHYENIESGNMHLWLRRLITNALRNSHDNDNEVDKYRENTINDDTCTIVKKSSFHMLGGQSISCLISEASLNVLQVLPTKLVFTTEHEFHLYIKTWFNDHVKYWPSNVTFELARIFSMILYNKNGECQLTLSDFPNTFIMSLIQHWDQLILIPNIKSNTVFSEIELISKWLNVIYQDGNTSKKLLEHQIKHILESRKDLISYCRSQIELIENIKK